MFIAIIVNSALMIWGLTEPEEELANLLTEIDNYFLYLFTAEVAIKVIGVGFLNYFSDSWNQFDFGLVCISYLTDAAMSFLSVARHARTARFLKISRLQKALRITKTVRGLRIFKFCMSLLQSFYRIKQLLEIILITLPAIWRTFSLILILFYLYAVVGIEIFREQNLVRADIPIYGISQFYSFAEGILELAHIMIANGWSDLMYNYCQRFENVVTSQIFFISFNALVNIVMRSLLSGLVWEIFSFFDKSANSNNDLAEEVETDKQVMSTQDIAKNLNQNYFHELRSPEHKFYLTPVTAIVEYPEFHHSGVPSRRHSNTPNPGVGIRNSVQESRPALALLLRQKSAETPGFSPARGLGSRGNLGFPKSSKESPEKGGLSVPNPKSFANKFKQVNVGLPLALRAGHTMEGEMSEPANFTEDSSKQIVKPILIDGLEVAPPKSITITFQDSIKQLEHANLFRKDFMVKAIEFSEAEDPPKKGAPFTRLDSRGRMLPTSPGLNQETMGKTPNNTSHLRNKAAELNLGPLQIAPIAPFRARGSGNSPAIRPRESSRQLQSKKSLRSPLFHTQFKLEDRLSQTFADRKQSSDFMHKRFESQVSIRRRENSKLSKRNGLDELDHEHNNSAIKLKSGEGTPRSNIFHQNSRQTVRDRATSKPELPEELPQKSIRINSMAPRPAQVSSLTPKTIKMDSRDSAPLSTLLQSKFAVYESALETLKTSKRVPKEIRFFMMNNSRDIFFAFFDKVFLNICDVTMITLGNKERQTDFEKMSDEFMIKKAMMKGADFDDIKNDEIKFLQSKYGNMIPDLTAFLNRNTLTSIHMRHKLSMLLHKNLSDPKLKLSEFLNTLYVIEHDINSHILPEGSLFKFNFYIKSEQLNTFLWTERNEEFKLNRLKTYSFRSNYMDYLSKITVQKGVNYFGFDVFEYEDSNHKKVAGTTKGLFGPLSVAAGTNFYDMSIEDNIWSCLINCIEREALPEFVEEASSNRSSSKQPSLSSSHSSSNGEQGTVDEVSMVTFYHFCAKPEATLRDDSFLARIKDYLQNRNKKGNSKGDTGRSWA